MAERRKVVVFDDDPTGSQTLHGCPLLLRWDRRTLRRGLAHPSPFLFLLANTRALAPEAAGERLRAICRELRPALAEARDAGELDQWLLVSRGDSTLRGHFPLEVQVLVEELGPFDATLLVPAFLPGGRTTRDGVHLLQGEPVHTTAFARDRLFGYRHSFLPAWVEEKSAGRIPAAAVQRLGLAALDRAAAALEAGTGEGARQGEGTASGFQELCGRLAGFEGNPCVAVDAERPQQLAALGAAVRELTAPAATERWGRPRRFLFQSAASLLNGLAEIGEPPLDPAGLAALRRRDGAGRPLPGLVLVGSHVPLADAQLERLLAQPGCAGLELPVARLARVLEGPLPETLLASLEREWGARLEALLAGGRTPVLFTSRGELHCRHAAERRRLGLALAGLMARLAARLAPGLGYLISKGGTTSQTLLAEGLQLALVELQGQLAPGLSLVLTPAEAAVPLLPVVTFPGNLGDGDSLVAAWRLLEGPGGAAG
ncbi:MAG: four-carbon acid sugar kinase family protein [Cyanobium sp. M30B3]|nr:MAG: four-carbon acid sugar kinase family protein [Cyanobium sp. M30B3]